MQLVSDNIHNIWRRDRKSGVEVVIMRRKESSAKSVIYGRGMADTGNVNVENRSKRGDDDNSNLRRVEDQCLSCELKCKIDTDPDCATKNKVMKQRKT